MLELVEEKLKSIELEFRVTTCPIILNKMCLSSLFRLETLILTYEEKEEYHRLVLPFWNEERAPRTDGVGERETCCYICDARSFQIGQKRSSIRFREGENIFKRKLK